VTRPRRILRCVALAIALALLGLAATASAALAPASVTVGAVPSLSAGATSLGTVAAATPLALTVVLAPRDPAGLAALATAVSTPGSPQYHHYLSVAEFAARFGAPTAQVDAVRAALRGDGLTPGTVAPNGLSIAVSGSAARASQAFNVSLHRYRQRDGRQVYANTAAPRVPAALGGVVQDVLGLDNLPAAAPADLRRATSKPAAHAVSAPLFGSGGVSPCADATNNTRPSGPYTVNQVAGAYGMDGLYANGDFGAGVTVALYELEPYSASDLTAFQSCYGTSAAVTNVEVDGGPVPSMPPDPQSGLETALDLDNVIGIAPSSNIDVYQGPNDGNGTYDTFAAIVNANTAQVVSDSWGLCESSALTNDHSMLSAENTLFEQAAAQGQSIVVAAGDAGSEGCDGSTNLAVDDAASQPFVTGVGGTTLSTVVPPAAGSVWNDGTHGAGGGGISLFWAMPSYQSALGVNGLSSGSPCGASVGYCREVPDVSADASPSEGYEVYYAGLGGWVAVGGTSAAAPVWAGLTTLADASGMGVCSPGSPLGFLNPTLYAIAATTSGPDAFNDVLSGNNNPSGSGDYPATAGYDMASGLGTPLATDGASPGLVAQLCGPTESIIAPAAGVTYTQTQSVPAAYSCVSPTPGTPTCTGSLPSGSPIDTSATGQHSFTVTATDSIGTTTHRTVAYTVVPRPAATITIPANGGAYTEGQTLSASYGCTASTSAAPSCAGTLPSGARLDTATLGAHSFSVTATDANGIATTATANYTIVAPPHVTVALPAKGAGYAQGSHVRASFGCAASAPLTITRCTSPIADGTAIHTSSLGPKSFTVTAVDSNGVATVDTIRYTVVAVRPTISGLRQSAAVWLEHHSARNGVAVGTKFSFSLDQAATLTFSFARAQTGRIAGGRCSAASAANSNARSCIRQLPAGTVTLKEHAGTDTLTFSGTTSSGALAPGTYTVLVSAVGVGRQRSAIRSLRFVVASPTGR
jgi:subtilase family serine protease